MVISVIKVIMWALQRINYVTRDSSTTDFRRLYFSWVLVEKILAGQKANQRAVNVFLIYIWHSLLYGEIFN